MPIQRGSRSRIHGLLLLLILLLLPILTAHGEAGYTLPEAVSLPGVADGEELYFELRPFGWSRDGAFAYMSVREVDGRGGVIFRYVVIDAVRDELLAVVEDDSFDWDNGAMDPTPEYSWRRSRRSVEEMLRAHSIVQSKSAVRTFPLEAEAGRYDASVLISPDAEAEDPAFDRLESYQVWVRQDGTAAKRISRQRDVFGVDAKVSGYLRSPYEPRMLVVVLEEHYVFEGTELHPRLFGSHLNYGFRPRSVLGEERVGGSYVHEADVAFLEVTEHTDGTLRIAGWAEWHGPMEGSVHVGEVDVEAYYADGWAYCRGEQGCELRLEFEPGGLKVEQFGECGGMNVTFGGSYRREGE